MNRRRLVASLTAFALTPGASPVRGRATGVRPGLIVLVRQRDEPVAVDPWTGDVISLDSLPATPATRATPAPESTPTQIPNVDVGYWTASPGGGAAIWQAKTGEWWWQGSDHEPRPLELPPALQPALPSGTVARWFHGATVDAAHLGTGTLRLIAVDIETGEIAIDRSFDRRLELAATAVSDDGAVVAHVQGGNTHIDFWAADLVHGTEVDTSVPIQPPAPVAPGAIDLEVGMHPSQAVIAAGLRWESPGHPDPRVIVVGMAADGSSRVTEVPGELIGIQPLIGG